VVDATTALTAPVYQRLVREKRDTMSRKDYKVFAAAMSEVHDRITRYDFTGLEAWKAIVDEMADIFSSDNGNFDYTRFLDACLKHN
jgi:hypothetical protein